MMYEKVSDNFGQRAARAFALCSLAFGQGGDVRRKTIAITYLKDPCP